MRLILFLVLAYILWKVIQMVFRVFFSQGGGQRHQATSGRPRSKGQQFRDVQDAEFEELPPDENKGGTNGGT